MVHSNVAADERDYVDFDISQQLQKRPREFIRFYVTDVRRVGEMEEAVSRSRKMVLEGRECLVEASMVLGYEGKDDRLNLTKFHQKARKVEGCNVL